MEWEEAKKQLLRNNWRVRLLYYLGKPAFWLESYRLRKQIKNSYKTGMSESTLTISSDYSFH